MKELICTLIYWTREDEVEGYEDGGKQITESTKKRRKEREKGKENNIKEIFCRRGE